LNKETDFQNDEQYAVTITIDGQSIIFMIDDPKMSKAEKEMILYHEKGHAVGYKSELDADLYAMRFVGDEARQILIDNWKDRHGHEYKG
jgi:hypothetical protein